MIAAIPTWLLISGLIYAVLLIWTLIIIVPELRRAPLVTWEPGDDEIIAQTEQRRAEKRNRPTA